MLTQLNSLIWVAIILNNSSLFNDVKHRDVDAGTFCFHNEWIYLFIYGESRSTQTVCRLTTISVWLHVYELVCVLPRFLCQQVQLFECDGIRNRASVHLFCISHYASSSRIHSLHLYWKRIYENCRRWLRLVIPNIKYSQQPSTNWELKPNWFIKQITQHTVMTYSFATFKKCIKLL